MKPRKVWDEQRKKVDRLTDGLGMPLDEGIKEIVVALNVYGFQTCMSCEGHADRACSYPWVWIEQPSTKKDKKFETFNRMSALLMEFYSNEERRFDRDAKLTIVPRGTKGDFRLQGNGGELLDQLPREILTTSMRAKIVKRYRQEMNAFCRFLKDKFFTT